MVQAASCYVPDYNVTLITGSELDQKPLPGREQLTHFLLPFFQALIRGV